MCDLLTHLGEYKVGTTLRNFRDRDRTFLREHYSSTSSQITKPNARLNIHFVRRKKNSLTKEWHLFLQGYLKKNMECLFNGAYIKELPAFVEYISYFIHDPHCLELVARLKKKDERGFNLLPAQNHLFIGDYRAKKVDIFISDPEDTRSKDISHYLREILPRLLSLTGFFLYQKKDVILLHAAGVRIANKGFLFPAASGDGKTTIASLSPQGSVLSDEHMFVEKKDRGYNLFGIPTNGFKKKNFGNTRLVKVFDLIKDKKTYVEDISIPSFAVEVISAHLRYACYLNRRMFSKKVKLVNDLLNTVPVQGLHFKKDKKFIRYLNN
jgi:hypothetical protein